MEIYVGKNGHHMILSHFSVVPCTSYKEWKYILDRTNIVRVHIKCIPNSIISMHIQVHECEKYYIET